MEQENKILLFTVTLFMGMRFERTFILNAHVNKKQSEILESKDTSLAKERAELHTLLAGAVRRNFGYTEDKGYYILFSPYELKEVSIQGLGF